MSATMRTWPLLVAGEWRETGEWCDVRSPYDDTVVARAAWGGDALVADAIDAAAAAMRRPLPTAVRAELLERISASVREHVDELAEALCREAGKPITAARAEVARAAATFRAAAVETQLLAGETVALPETDFGARKIGFTVRKPVGVVGAITPFNFPLNLSAHKLAPALAAGCAVVHKPAEKAPGAAVLLARIATDAGLPTGWLNVVLAPPEEVAQRFASDDRVRLITFTGSARVGWSIAREAATKRVTLELGNVTPVIVAQDADVELAAAKVAASAFAFSGQTCLSTQRVFVAAPVRDRFLTTLETHVRALRVGDPADPATDVGPLIDPTATERVAGWIDEAVAAGATVLTGGARDGALLAPTVLLDAPAECALADQEAFGPVLLVWTFDDLDAALGQANATQYGLQAAIFTRNIQAALCAVRELDFGGVIVNDAPTFRQDAMPYGGVKHSGNTREGPGRAIREMTEECLVVLDG